MASNNRQTVSITIRDVPNGVRNELAARAARKGQSLQEYLRLSLIDLTAYEPVDVVMARARARAEAAGVQISDEDILAARDADRR